MVRSRAKLAYETVQPADLPAELHELARRVERGRGRPRGAARRVPRAGAGRRRRALGVAVRPSAPERGRERRTVAGDQPGGRRRAPRRSHRAVPGDARADGGRRAPAAPDGPGVRAGVAGDAVTRRLPALLADGRPAGGRVPHRRAAGRWRRLVRAVRPGRDAVARRDGGHLRPRHGAAAPPRRSLRGRGDACDRQRSARARRGHRRLRRPARGDGQGRAAGQQRRARGDRPGRGGAAVGARRRRCSTPSSSTRTVGARSSS